MGSIENSCLIPSVNYSELLTNDGAAEVFVQALKTYGACRIREHGIPKDIINNCFEKVCGSLNAVSFAFY
jgi:hypothetical protein